MENIFELIELFGTTSHFFFPQETIIGLLSVYCFKIQEEKFIVTNRKLHVAGFINIYLRCMDA
jgi:hypothetical protein